MSYELRIRPAADVDISETADYLARDSVDAAIRYFDRADETLDLIREGPMRWAEYAIDHPRLIGLRRRSVLGFPRYLAFYLIDEDVVDVLRVLHSARDIPSILRTEVEGEA